MSTDPRDPAGPPRTGSPDEPRDDDVRGLLGAYALDAVDDLERRAVERLVARDPAAAAELAELRATAAVLGDAAASPPPADLRAAVLAAAAATPQEQRRPAAPADRAAAPVRQARRRAPSRLALAAAAAAVVAVAVPSSLAWQQHERAVVAEQRAEDLAALLAAPGTEVLSGDLAGGGTAVAVLAEDAGVLLADGLPALGADETYQLWAMRDGTPVPAGLFAAAPGTVQVEAEDYRPGDGLAVSVEPAGGSEQPTTTPLVVLVR